MGIFSEQIKANINEISEIGEKLTEIQKAPILCGDKLVASNLINNITLVYGYIVKGYMNEELGLKEIILHFGILYDRLKKIKKHDDFLKIHLGSNAFSRITRNQYEHALSKKYEDVTNEFSVEKQIEIINHILSVIETIPCDSTTKINDKFNNSDILKDIQSNVNIHDIDREKIAKGLSLCYSYIENFKFMDKDEQGQLLVEIAEIIVLIWSLLSTTAKYKDIAFTNELMYQQVNLLEENYRKCLIEVLNSLPKHPTIIEGGKLVENAQVYLDDFKDAIDRFSNQPNQDNMNWIYYNARDVQYILGYSFHVTNCLPLYFYQVFDKFGLYIYHKYKDRYLSLHNDKDHYFKNIKKEITQNNFKLTYAEEQIMLFDYNNSNSTESKLYKLLNMIRQKIEHKLINPFNLEEHHDALLMFEYELAAELIPKIGFLMESASKVKEN